MKFTTHPFERTDLAKLWNFLGEVRQDIHRSHYLHVGDLSWQLFHMLAAHNPSNLINLWRDERNTLIGFALVYPDFGMIDLQIHPSFRLLELETEMLSWAQAQITKNNKCIALYTLVNEHDTFRKTVLESQHYRPMGDWLYMQRSLTLPISSPQVSPTYRVTDMTNIDFTTRAQALGQAFGAQARPQLYQKFMTMPGYSPELDIVTVDSAEQVVSFAMCWIDAISKDGEFEPVGTVPEFQRRGLGKTTLNEGMRRMRERGMENVIVIVDAAEEGACRLYESVGLVPRWKLQLYGKEI